MLSKQDFRIPFEKDKPQVGIFDRVFFIPPTADRSQFTFPGWDSPLLFGERKGPIAVEFCSGNGSWILEKAQQHPSISWVAVEKRFDRVRKIWVKMKRMGLDNVIIVFGEALSFSTSYIPTQSIDTLYINFPDPWPKARHVKHRIISPLLMSEAARTIKHEGRFIFVTDDAPYSSWFEEIFEECGAPSFTSVFPKPYFQAPPEDYGTSFFDTLFRSQGKTIHFHELMRTSHESSTSSSLHTLPTKGLLTSISHMRLQHESK